MAHNTLPLPNYVKKFSAHYWPQFYKTPGALRVALSGNILINQTSFRLSDNDIELLCLGLNFIPSPIVTPEEYFVTFEKAFDKWSQAIDTALYFHDNPSANRKGWLHSEISSTWVPPVGSWMSDEQVLSAKDELSGVLRPDDSNSLSILFNCISRLKSEHSIHILKADKGRSTVIWSADDYDKEALRQLGDVKSYKQLNRDTFLHRLQVATSDCHDYAQTLYDIGCFTSRERDAFLKIEPGNGSAFYLLPKIHKSANPFGSFFGRPIVATFSNPIHLIDKYLANLTSFLLRLIPGSLVDTPDLLARLKELPPLSAKAAIVTADIDSMYPNIPWKEGIEASVEVYTKFLPDLQKYALDNQLPAPPPFALFADLLTFVLNNSLIHFKNKDFFHQQTGTAMGMCISVFFANAYMYIVSRDLIGKENSKVILFVRYIDDILVIFNDANDDDVRLFFRAITNDYMRYTVDRLAIEQNFLDVTVMINQTNFMVETKPYWKPTASGSYLHPATCHPPHTIRSLPFSQFLRLYRISHPATWYEDAANRLETELIRSGYNKDLVKSARRNASLPNHLAKNNRSTVASSFKFIIPFHSELNHHADSHFMNGLHDAITNHYRTSDVRRATFLARQKSSIIFSVYRSLGSYFTSHIKQGVREH